MELYYCSIGSVSQPISVHVIETPSGVFVPLYSTGQVFWQRNCLSGEERNVTPKRFLSSLLESLNQLLAQIFNKGRVQIMVARWL